MAIMTGSQDAPLNNGTEQPSELNQWLFTDEELERTPSILDGMSQTTEAENRTKGANFIYQAGMMLRLPQITVETATVFFHRFYMRHSMVDKPGHPGYHYYVRLAHSCDTITSILRIANIPFSLLQLRRFFSHPRWKRMLDT
jgi:hypothetical protein